MWSSRLTNTIKMQTNIKLQFGGSGTTLLNALAEPVTPPHVTPDPNSQDGHSESYPCKESVRVSIPALCTVISHILLLTTLFIGQCLDDHRGPPSAIPRLCVDRPMLSSHPRRP